MRSTGFVVRCAGLAAAVWIAAVAMGAETPLTEPIRVMVIGGQNNHDWKRSTPYLYAVLNQASHIEATIVNAPPAGASAAAWSAWSPRFSDYDCIVLDYNGEMWPADIREAFVSYIRGGGTAIAIHAANNAFNGWTEFEQMVGLLWRAPTYGAALRVDEHGVVVRDEPGQGRGMGHGGVYDWLMTVRDADHPVTRGMPKIWQHRADELYHGQRGPAKDVHILITAYSDPAQRGTGENEPIVWWVPYGKGKVVTNLMGHVGDLASMQCVGFRTTLLRSCEWLATGSCRTAIPPNFPSAEATQVVALTPALAAAIAEASVRRISEPVSPTAVSSGALQPGLSWRFYEGDWDRLPDFSSLVPARTGVAPNVSLDPSPVKDGYGLVFSGYLAVSAPGDYTFHTTSDDGSALYLGGVLIVDNDGTHPAVEASGRVTLSPGLYAFEVRFFEKSGGEDLSVSYSGPGVEKQALPEVLLRHRSQP